MVYASECACMYVYDQKHVFVLHRSHMAARSCHVTWQLEAVMSHGSSKLSCSTDRKQKTSKKALKFNIHTCIQKHVQQHIRFYQHIHTDSHTYILVAHRCTRSPSTSRRRGRGSTSRHAQRNWCIPLWWRSKWPTISVHAVSTTLHSHVCICRHRYINLYMYTYVHTH